MKVEEQLAEKAKEKAGQYAHDSELKNGFDMHPKTASFQGYLKGYRDGYQAGLDEFALAEIQAFQKGLAQKDAEWQGKIKNVENYLEFEVHSDVADEVIKILTAVK